MATTESHPQGVLEDLLEAQELDDAFVDVLLEAQAALIGADGAVELAAPATVGVPIAIVIFPHNAEGEHTLGLNHAVQQVSLDILRVLLDDSIQRGEHFLDGLDELGLVCVLSLDVFDDAFNVGIH